jgi:hypothetical protein
MYMPKCSLLTSSFCRYCDSPKARLQTFCKTRFSGIKVLLDSLQKYRGSLENAVRAQKYATLVKRAMKKGSESQRCPMDDDHNVPKELQAAEKNLRNMEVGLYNTKAVPDPLIGTKKYARIFLDITSARYWEAAKVQFHTVSRFSTDGAFIAI